GEHVAAVRLVQLLLQGAERLGDANSVSVAQHAVRSAVHFRQRHSRTDPQTRAWVLARAHALLLQDSDQDPGRQEGRQEQEEEQDQQVPVSEHSKNKNNSIGADADASVKARENPWSIVAESTRELVGDMSAKSPATCESDNMMAIGGADGGCSSNSGCFHGYSGRLPKRGSITLGWRGIPEAQRQASVLPLSGLSVTDRG
ncbi:hypothetical protein VaNZ11_016835, partial [Volvox africanus]